MEQKQKYICWLLGYKYMRTDVTEVNESAAAIQYAKWRGVPHSSNNTDVIICVQDKNGNVNAHHVKAHVDVTYTAKYDPHIIPE